MARRRLPQTRSIERRRRRVAPLDDDAVAGPGPAMARRAVDVEALPSARHDRLVDWKRERGDILVVHLACIEHLIVPQLAARDGAGSGGRADAVVGKKGAASSARILRLIVHVLAAREGTERLSAAAATYAIAIGLARNGRYLERTECLEKPAGVFSSSNLESRASMHRKKRFRLASAKRGTLNTGWYGIGRPFNANMPSTADSAATRMVHSKVTGMNIGQLL